MPIRVSGQHLLDGGCHASATGHCYWSLSLGRKVIDERLGTGTLLSGLRKSLLGGAQFAFGLSHPGIQDGEARTQVVQRVAHGDGATPFGESHLPK